MLLVGRLASVITGCQAEPVPACRAWAALPQTSRIGTPAPPLPHPPSSQPRASAPVTRRQALARVSKLGIPLDPALAELGPRLPRPSAPAFACASQLRTNASWRGLSLPARADALGPRRTASVRDRGRGLAVSPRDDVTRRRVTSASGVRVAVDMRSVWLWRRLVRLRFAWCGGEAESIAPLRVKWGVGRTGVAKWSRCQGRIGR